MHEAEQVHHYLKGKCKERENCVRSTAHDQTCKQTI